MTTAGKTAFTSVEVTGPNGTVFFDGNAKITGLNGTFDNPAANAFSLVQILDCPFRTDVCESACYVHNLEKYNPPLHDKYHHNSKMVRKILGMKGSWDYAKWVKIFADHLRTHAPHGFRWHVSGDIFSEEYAHFIRYVAIASGTPQWIYTRSLPYVHVLCALDNLEVNISADSANYRIAKHYAEHYDLRVCYFTSDGSIPDDLPEGSVIFPDYGLRGYPQPGTSVSSPKDSLWWQGLYPRQKRMVCPVDFFGKSPSIRCGICTKCMK